MEETGENPGVIFFARVIHGDIYAAVIHALLMLTGDFANFLKEALQASV